MPYLSIATNAAISTEAAATFLRDAAKTVATGTGKPVQYVMARLDQGQPMLFAGSDEPTAWLELKSIGFPAQGVGDLASSLCDLAANHLGVPPERVFTAFTDVKASMWGQGGETFG